MLAAFKVLKAKGYAKRMIVLAPLKPMSNVWPSEITDWKEFKHFKYVVLHGSKKDKLLAEALADDVDIIITNFDSLNWLFGAEKSGAGRRRKVVVDTARVASLGADILVVDEISGFKDPGTLRFKILYAARRQFPRFWGLTGSPASNGLMNLFGIMLMTDMGYSLGTYVTHFRFKYFTQLGTYVYKPKKGALEEITKACSKTAISMSADDYLTLPELVENDIKVVLPPAARALYDELEDAMIVAVSSDRKIVASNAAVASGKIRQIASGAVYLTPEPEDPDAVLQRLMDNQRRVKTKADWMAVHDEKLDAIAGLLDELNGQPVIIVYEWNHTLTRLQARFGAHATMAGKMKPAECKRVEDQWNNNELTILYGQPAAMAKGLNLQGGNACHIILADMIWDYELYDQLIRRLRRQGNKATHVFVHRIIAVDTVDVRVGKALSDKENVQLAVYAGLKLGKKPR